MTIPYLMNCSHSEDGWCLRCVAKLGEAMQEAIEEVVEHNREYQHVTLETTINTWREALKGTGK